MSASDFSFNLNRHVPEYIMVAALNKPSVQVYRKCKCREQAKTQEEGTTVRIVVTVTTNAGGESSGLNVPATCAALRAI